MIKKTYLFNKKLPGALLNLKVLVGRLDLEAGNVGVLVGGGEGVDEAAHRQLLLHAHRDEVNLGAPGRRELGRKVVDVDDGEDEVAEALLRRVGAGVGHLGQERQTLSLAALHIWEGVRRTT